MKKRSVLYTWAIEFAILLALMTAMCITLTFSARRKLLDEYIDITDQQQDKIEIALNNSSFVYRKGLIESNYSYSMAVSLVNSLVNFLLVVVVNKISAKVSETSLW